MRRFFVSLVLAAAVSLSLAPPATAGDGLDDELASQAAQAPREMAAVRYADAGAVAPQQVPPITEVELATPPPAVVTPPANDTGGSIVNLLPTADSILKVIGTLLGGVLATLIAQLSGMLPGPLADWLKKSFKVQDVLHDIAQTDYAKKLITVGLTYVLSRLGLKAETLDHVDVGSDTVARVIAWLQEQEPSLISWIMSASAKTDETVPAFVAPIINQIIDEKKAVNDNRAAPAKAA